MPRDILQNALKAEKYRFIDRKSLRSQAEKKS